MDKFAGQSPQMWDVELAQLPHPLNTFMTFLLTGCLKALLRHTPAALFRVMWWWCCFAVVERSISRRRKRRPGGTTLHAKANLPMRKSNSLFVQVRLPRMWPIACSSSVFLSFVMEAVMERESRSMPRKVMAVVGPSSFSGFVGEPIRWHRVFMITCWPAVKKSSR